MLILTKPNSNMIAKKNTQNGVVLFIAMIALVVMSLAAVALIRSVDTNTLITGNLSFKQTSIASSSYGIESLSDYLGREIRREDGKLSNPGVGYYAVCTTTSSDPNLCDGLNITNNATWQAGARSRLADGIGITGGVDAYGNTVEYIVERMCRAPDADFEDKSATAVGIVKSSCLVAKRNNDNGSKNVLNATLVGAPDVLTDLPVYRVTVRVTGPKNTISYIQSFIS